MMKEIYEKPVVEVIEFETEDVITTSGLMDDSLLEHGSEDW